MSMIAPPMTLDAELLPHLVHLPQYVSTRGVGVLLDPSLPLLVPTLQVCLAAAFAMDLLMKRLLKGNNKLIHIKAHTLEERPKLSRQEVMGFGGHLGGLRQGAVTPTPARRYVMGRNRSV